MDSKSNFNWCYFNAASGLCMFIVGSSYISLTLFFILTAIYSAHESLPMYSLAIAHTNDFVRAK